MNATESTMTIGNGSSIHQAYMVKGNLCGSLCNPFAWERSRVRLSTLPANCPRCAKATTRAAEQERISEEGPR